MSINVPPGILDEIISNGGGTLARKNVHVGSVDDNNYEIQYLPIDLPTTGYYVGEYNVAVVGHPIYDTYTDLRRALNESFIPEGYKRSEAYFLGFWRDETGRWYIDISRHHETKGQAILAAAINREIAIWDIANNREIVLIQD